MKTISKVQYTDLRGGTEMVDIMNEMIDLMDAAAKAFDDPVTTGTALNYWAKQYKLKRRSP